MDDYNYNTPYREKAFPSENSDGMNLRDYFAAKALPTIIARYENLNQNHDYIAKLAYGLADAMLAARGK
jgi:hypothetical protein